ncbi:uncharacterized protein PG986_011349 [Apiospora aurea]|uniref:Uncharacterized protein n=1 Tax=Apiospora aurea TaxID=335848 RepID=A0ABR1Q4T3_9PEZI
MASSSNPYTTGANMVSPARMAKVHEIFESNKAKGVADDRQLKEAFAMFADAPAASPTASDFDCAVSDDASNYDRNSTDFPHDFNCDMDVDDVSCWPAPLNPRRPALIPAPTEYKDLASKSPYDEEFGDKGPSPSGTIAGRRGKDGLRIEAPGAIGACNDKPTALPTSKHHQRCKSERPAPPCSTREQALQRILEMDRQSLALADSVAQWERGLQFQDDDELASPCAPPSFPIYE